MSGRHVEWRPVVCQVKRQEISLWSWEEKQRWQLLKRMGRGATILFGSPKLQGWLFWDTDFVLFIPDINHVWLNWETGLSINCTRRSLNILNDSQMNLLALFLRNNAWLLHFTWNSCASICCEASPSNRLHLAQHLASSLAFGECSAVGHFWPDPSDLQKAGTFVYLGIQPPV